LHKTDEWWRYVDRFTFFDLELSMIKSSLQWALQYNRYDLILKIADRFSSYCHVRGFWDVRLDVERARLTAAVNTNNTFEQIDSLSVIIGVLSRQNNILTAEKYYLTLQQTLLKIVILPEVLIEAKIANGVYWISYGALERARCELQEALDSNRHAHANQLALNQRWLGVCLYKLGRLEEAEQILKAALRIAENDHHIRAVHYIYILLAAIDLDRQCLDTAESKLSTSCAWARHYYERERLAAGLFLSARLHTLRGDLPAARAALAEAIDLFERLGMRRELAQARASLADLDAREVAEAAG